MLENKKYDWRDLSLGYLFAVVESGHFVKGMDNHLHPETKVYLNYILNTIQQYQKFPSFEHLREKYNLHYQYCKIPHLNVNEICDRIRLERVKYQTQFAMGELQKRLTTEGMTIADFLNPLQKLQEEIYNAEETETYRLTDFGKILHYYRENAGERVCGYGLPTLDNYTGGISKGDFIVLYANTSQGKSTIARHIAGNIAQQGKLVLYFTLEESGRKSVLKTLSTQIQTPFRPLVDGTYDHECYQKMHLFHPTGDVVFVDRLESGTISEIARWVSDISPDIIIIDQIPHLVRDRHSALWEAITAISSQLRQYSQNHKIPTIALTQANRAGQKKNISLEESISLAYAQAQDASHIIFLHPDEEGTQYTRKRITLAKNRDNERGQSIDLKWEIGKGIIEEEVISADFYQGGYTIGTINTGSAEIPTGVPTHPQPQPVPPNYGTSMGNMQTHSAGVQQPSNQGNPTIPVFKRG